ncbi:dormancy-associated protein homolog 3-like isoform X1 [Rhodamnia argentea]|uniref:Dormancy-associated protein homolog 3-like isoform X1 n=1 Tax=Rhodamnia argentea TaxID=178133 RepID=A0A8B8QKI9_9MYRT|nr:dormancy-associated protein homolog 3-like isoform X1 [Rhodamnia argentea]
MGLLDQLWDDTVAGPRPESGLGRLRKFNTFSFRSSSGKESEGGGDMKTYGVQEATPSEEAIRVTRSITIVKPRGYQSGSPPVSPAGSTPPVSPFSGPRKDDDINELGTGINGVGNMCTQEVEEGSSCSEGGRCPMRTRSRARLDPGALLLLTTCEL